MTAFDLLLRGGTLIDGTGSAGRPADVGVLGDRILAVGDLSAVDGGRGRACSSAPAASSRPGSSIRTAIPTARSSSTGRSPATCTRATRPSCRGTAATRWRRSPTSALRPWTCSLRPERARRRAGGRSPSTSIASTEQPLGLNVAFLVGQGTIRGSVLGADARAPTDEELAAMVREVEDAIDAGAFGLSLGTHLCARDARRARRRSRPWSRRRRRRGGLYATHMRNESDGLFALARRVDRARSAPAGRGARLQVSHLKCGAQAGLGTCRRSGRAPRGGPRRGPRRRRRPVPVHGCLDHPGHGPAAGCSRRSAWTSASPP